MKTARIGRSPPRLGARLLCALALAAAVLLAGSSSPATERALSAPIVFVTGDVVIVQGPCCASWFGSDGAEKSFIRLRSPDPNARTDPFPPTAVAFAPDGTPYIGDSGGVVRRYDAEGRLIGFFGIFPEPFEITAMARAPDGVLYVAASQGTATDVYPYVSFGRTRNPFSVRGEIVDLDVAADSCTLYYALRSGRVKRVNGCVPGRELPEFATNARAAALRLLPDGTLSSWGRTA